MSAKRAPGRSLRLKTAEGIQRRPLPRPVHPDGKSGDADALKLLRDSLDQRWKTFRKRVRRGLPRRRGFDDAVHDLRTASRRLLSVLEGVDAVAGGKAVRKLSKKVSRVLDLLGPARDLSVERQMLSKVARRDASPGLRAFERRLNREYRNEARRARRRVARVDPRDFKADRSRIAKRLGRLADRDEARGGLLKAARASGERLKRRRALIDPTQVVTLHRTRVALKKFRYLLEAIAPVVPGAAPPALETLHALQTTMGDLHDVEVLTAALARHVAEEAPSEPRDFARALAELETKHSGMLRSFLASVDPILAYWTDALAD